MTGNSSRPTAQGGGALALVGAILLGLLTGCAGGAKKGPPMPPMPELKGEARPHPGPLPRGEGISRAALLGNATTTVKTSSGGNLVLFAPASSAVGDDRPVFIVPFGPNYYLVAVQQDKSPGGSIEWQRTDTIEGGWQFLASIGGVPQGEWFSAIIPADWLPYHRMFAKAITTADSGFAPAGAAGVVERDTGKTVLIKGRVFHVWELPLPVAWTADPRVPIYHLKP